jgi:transcriptional regulator with XRE-family HTH domain
MSGAKRDRKQIHIGHNIQRTREIVGIKQFALAESCGWSQQQMSKLENSEDVEDETLETIAKNLGVTPEFIKHFNEEKTVYYIQNNNTFRDNSSTQHFKPVLNNGSVDQLMSILEKYLEEDKKKSSQIESLTKSVMDLAEEVKRMKSGK